MSRLPRSPALLALLSCLVWMGNAQDSTPSGKSKDADAIGSADVRFADGSSVRMFMAQSSVDITTRFGKLTVPVEDIRRIEFGFRYPDGVKAKIDDSITKLASSHAEDHVTATKELLAFGRMAYPSLKRLASGTDTEAAKRANGVLAKLEEKVGADKMRIQDQDTIHASEFVVTGKIEAATFKGKTAYFGDVTVQVAELRTIRFFGGGSGESEVVVDAAKYAALSRDVWMDTEAELIEGNTLEIVAAGIVDLYPSGGNYKVGPDAMPRQGQTPDGTPSGMLLGRIGEKGKPFQVGAKYSGTIGDSGRLYLRIECSPWNNASTGSFTVKINPNAEGGPSTAAPVLPKKFKGKKEN